MWKRCLGITSLTFPRFFGHANKWPYQQLLGMGLIIDTHRHILAHTHRAIKEGREMKDRIGCFAEHSLKIGRGMGRLSVQSLLLTQGKEGGQRR